MRHLKKGRKLGRDSSHRKALFKNLVTPLLKYEKIETTLAKAKELRGVTDRLVTLGKKGSLNAKREVLRLIKDKEAFKRLFDVLSTRYAERNGGYTRVIRLGARLGDGALMAVIELVDRDVTLDMKRRKKKVEDKEEQ
ncbi:MAG: 50S ribosomal protein L17 [Nitrospinae bacterium]|nr:50S ribosomal protein L17 [Nitrospinota bacterium]